MECFNKKVSIVFPAYNEEQNIEVCVLVAHTILTNLLEDFEIIVVDDGSTDKTKDICLQLEKRLRNFKLVIKENNEGYGFALRDGFCQCKFDLLFFSDADRQFDILNLRDLLRYADDYDIIVGFRQNRQDTLKRKFLSWGFNELAGLLFHLNARDIDCAFKLFHKRVFNSITIESKRFFFNTEFLAKAVDLKFSIKEVGVVHFPRVSGISKVGWKDVPRTLRELRRIYKSLNRKSYV